VSFIGAGREKALSSGGNMSLWKDYDEIPSEITASLFQNNASRESNLNHSMFTTSSIANGKATPSISSSIPNPMRKDRKSLFDEKVKISVSNGVNLFEEEDGPVLMRRSSSGEDSVNENDSYDLLYHEMKANLQRNHQEQKKVSLQLMDSSSDDEDEDGNVIIDRKVIHDKEIGKRNDSEKRAERDSTGSRDLDYKQLYEVEYQRRLELEKQVEQLTKQIQKLQKKQKREGDGGDDDDEAENEHNKSLLQEKVLSSEERRNLQLQRLKKSAMGNKKKMKSESQLSEAVPSVPSAKENSSLEEVKKKTSTSHVENKIVPSPHNLFSDSSGSDEEISSSSILQKSKSHPVVAAAPAAVASVERHQKNNLWESSDEEEEAEGTSAETQTRMSTSSSLQSDDLKAQMERERLEKQKARQRQLNQRNRRGGGGSSNSKRRVAPNVTNSNSSASNSKSSSIEPELQKEMNSQSQSAQVSHHQTIPRTGGNNWSDDDDDDEEESEEDSDVPPQQTPSLPQHTSSPSSILHSESSIEQIVLSWCRGKDLIAMIHTLQEVPTMSSSTIDLLRELQNHTFHSYDPQDVRKIYL
jgi:hypothetical protein